MRLTYIRALTYSNVMIIKNSPKIIFDIFTIWELVSAFSMDGKELHVWELKSRRKSDRTSEFLYYLTCKTIQPWPLFNFSNTVRYPRK